MGGIRPGANKGEGFAAATPTAAGAVNVLYGTASGLSASGGQFFSQDTPGVFGGAETEDGFGSALAVGDFNNDGFADLAIGVPSEGVGAAAQAGAVDVLDGSAARLTATGNQQVFQGSSGIGGVAALGDGFGFVLTGGDFNTASLALHARAGFRVIGTRERVGRHHGVWRDVLLIERRSPAIG